MKEKVRPMLEAAAKDYVSKNQPLAEAHGALRQVVVNVLSISPRRSRMFPTSVMNSDQLG